MADIQCSKRGAVGASVSRGAEKAQLEGEKAAKNRKTTASVALLLAACMVFLVLFAAVNTPNYKLNKAMRLMASGDYKTAYSLLNGLNYQDSAEEAGECLFRIQTARLTNVTVGSTIRFGSYEQDNKLSNGPEEIEWIVLAVDGSKVLVISKYGLDSQDFNDEYSQYSAITWNNSQLRTWLNDTFYQAAFSPRHQEMIVLSKVTADRNPESKVSPGRDTKDKIFLLSMDEANRYFDSDSARQCSGTAYCYAQGAEKGQDGACWWWLRTPGVEMSCPTVVIASGAVFPNGFSSGHRPILAVRPAMWIDLGEGGD